MKEIIEQLQSQSGKLVITNIQVIKDKHPVILARPVGKLNLFPDDFKENVIWCEVKDIAFRADQAQSLVMFGDVAQINVIINF